MLKTITLILIAAALLVAQNQQRETVLPTIPDGAAQAGPNLYRYTDNNGKAWLYVRTPFGISKREEKPAAHSVVDNSQLVAVTDLGDSVRFERRTPFGISTWVSKKNELTDGEQVMFLREQLKNQGASREVAPLAAQGKQ